MNNEITRRGSRELGEGTRWTWRRVVIVEQPLVIVRGHVLPSFDLDEAADWFWARRLDLAEAVVPHRAVVIGFDRDELRATIAGWFQSDLRMGPGH